MNKTTIVLFAGLPGTGKSTLAYRLAQDKGWCLLSKDQINRSLERENIDNGRAGYEVLIDLAELNVKNSVSVILDASFGFENLRQKVQEMAKIYQANFFGIECISTDEEVLKKRFDNRQEMVSGWKPADWIEHNRVKGYWQRWDNDRLTLDALEPIEKNYQKLINYITR